MKRQDSKCVCLAKTFTHIKELFPNFIKGIKGRENYDED